MGLYTEWSPARTSTMMKLVVLALAVSAVCGGVVPVGFHGLPVHGAYTGLGLHHTAYSGLPVGTVYSGLPVSTLSHTGYTVEAGEEVRPAVPVTYSAAPAPAIVAPQPYSVHTGTKVESQLNPLNNTATSSS